jgi:SAM-dependent methyltransferase
MNLSLRCPTCAHALRPAGAGFACANNHAFAYEAEALVLLDAAFQRELGAFLAGFEPFRQKEGKRLTDTAVYETLPFAPELQSDHEWRLRTYDIAVLRRLLAGREKQRILEIGAWNGWLSNWLTGQGHWVTAVDYFLDDYDGLGAQKHYRARWQAIQMDLTDLSVLADRFDIVLLNRCLQFFADPVAYAQAAAKKTAPGGLLILTGLSFFQDFRAKTRAVTEFNHYLQENGVPAFKPMKGYLDFADKGRLERAGVALRPYPQLWLANLKSRFNKAAPRYFYGVCRRPTMR